MSFVYTVSNYLNRYPGIKQKAKRIFQRTLVAVSPNFKAEGDIHKLSPNDSNHEYFFGYYDKSPWDDSGRYVLCLRAKDTWTDVAPDEPADICLIDTEKNNKMEIIAQTRAWNVQQACMLQWLGPDFTNEILYNDFRDGKYCSVILNMKTRQERILSMPVYSVSQDGNFALTLDFSRLHRLRKGYGYANLPDHTEGQLIPDEPCIWRLDLNSDKFTPVLQYTDFVNFEHRLEMDGAEHKVNHIMISPNGKRFMVLHRWFNGERKYTRLVTANIDGTDMYNLSDDDMVSHCCWKNDKEIFAFENKRDSGTGYYLMEDKTQNYQHYWPTINYDGHPSFSPDGKKIVFDQYPDGKRIAAVMVADDNRDGSVINIKAKVFAPFKYDNDTRCDLHPRWSRNGKYICFDAVFEGSRGLYYVEA